MTNVVIVGGGLSGLAAAHKLEEGGDKNYLLLEKGEKVGGLCATEKNSGFYFDYSGHLLHLKNEKIRSYIEKGLDKYGGLVEHQRKAFIYFKKREIPYPFQLNLYYLPLKEKGECFLGILMTFFKKNKKVWDYDNFAEWIMASLGAGVAKNFMFPYNKKLWQTDPKDLTTRWLSEYVPKPGKIDLIRGLLTRQNKSIGYNSTFLYPKKGGIGVLSEMLGRGVSNINLNEEVIEINLKEKFIKTKKGDQINYNHLILTSPLNGIAELIKDLPGDIKESAKKLKNTSVLNLNLGLKGDKHKDKHWVYFPEEKFPFYRVGFNSSFSDYVAPPGCYSMYVEIAYLPGEVVDFKKIIEKSKEKLEEIGYIKREDILVEEIFDMPVAYIVYDKYHERNSQIIKEFLEKNSIYPIGRYGAWGYDAMEEAIEWGFDVADKITKL